MDSLTKHRKTRLLALVEGAPYNGNQQVFAEKAKLSKGRISQMLDPDHSFGERSARALAGKLKLDEHYFENSFSQPEARETFGATTAPTPDRREPQPTLTPDAAYVAHWLNKVSDRETRERLAHACVTLILLEIDGPASTPTPEPEPQTETPSAARRVR